MKISATVVNTANDHHVVVKTNESESTLPIKQKDNGRGSSVNGGELLFLALASCYCNDIFREADEMGIEINSVEVNVEGKFGGKGEPARNVNYDVKISANSSKEKIKKLLKHTDSVAEIQNTLRNGLPVKLRRTEIIV